jgi:hypothetical protein
VTEADAQRLPLGDFRRRLVSALVTEDPIPPPPRRPTDIEAVQLHVGVRYLLLAPLYGYALGELRIESDGSKIYLRHDGVEESYPLTAFRARMRTHVREELERVTRASSRGAIELSRVAEAEQAAQRGDHVRVLELLGAWPAPLAIFLRTPDGQMLNAETRSLIARALGYLGSACIALGEVGKGEEVLRLGVQYAGDGPAAGDLYYRLGEAMHADGRPGEAIGPLRRAANLGAPGDRVWPMLAQALVARGRYLAALGAVLEGRSAGADPLALAPVLEAVRGGLGARFGAVQHLVEDGAR